MLDGRSARIRSGASERGAPRFRAERRRPPCMGRRSSAGGDLTVAAGMFSNLFLWPTHRTPLRSHRGVL
eukprot:4337441-Alexandrium_andersonii.AAC.1